MKTLQRLIILHSNDIHGHIDGLARIATLVKHIRAEDPAHPVLYFDAGDIEESTCRISNLTRGAGMHRLLSVAGCQAAAVGNGGVLRYGFEVLAEHGAAARYPLLLANIRWPDGSVPQGVQTTTIIQAGEIKLGVIGVTDPLFHVYTRHFGMIEIPVLSLIHALSEQLRQEGADAVLLLSHMGLRQDRELAADLQSDIAIIIGAHSHDLLPDGERIGKITISQARYNGLYLGRLDLCWNGEQLLVEQVSVIPIHNEIMPEPAIQSEIDAIEEDMAPFLNTIIGELVEPADMAKNRECAAANLLADALRARMQADVGMALAACAGPLPAGPLHRGTLYEAFHLPMHPGVTTMTGEQLSLVIMRGQDRAFAATSERPLRCHERGLLHLSGAYLRSGQIFVGESPIEPARSYRVASGRWELESFGGYIEKAWNLAVTYETPTTLCEAMEAYLIECGPLRVSRGRLG